MYGFFGWFRYRFNIDGAMKILRFSIRESNKNLDIYNHLLTEDISKKILRKVEKIYSYYKEFLNSENSTKLENFLENVEENKQNIYNLMKK